MTMQKFMKFIVISVLMMSGLMVFATTPQIKNVKAMQPYPCDGKVYISFEMDGNVRDDAASIWITAKDKNTGRVYGVVCAGSSFLLGDTTAFDGQHRIVWDIAAQGIMINSPNVVFAIEYRDDMYMVIDLSSGAYAAAYPVSYMGAPPDGGFNTDDYKTTKLVLRCVPPDMFKMCGEYNVTITKPFYIGIFEVTQKQYELVGLRNPSKYAGSMRPVENLSFDTIRGSTEGAQWPTSSVVDRASFLGRLRDRTGLDFDLPTEAQWEYACRAGSTSDYNNGGNSEEDIRQLGRYANNQSDGKGGYSSNYTTVGSYLPNAFGLYDMHGNVFEWCLDWYGDLSEGGYDPVGPLSGTCRVLRGGSWYSLSSHVSRFDEHHYGGPSCTSSSREYKSPSDSYSVSQEWRWTSSMSGYTQWAEYYSVDVYHIGFRIAVVSICQ